MKKTRRFRLHFNRVNMQRGNSKVWTVHIKGLCMQAENVVAKVPLVSVFKPEGRQPRAYFVGDAVPHWVGNTLFLLGHKEAQEQGVIA